MCEHCKMRPATLVPLSNEFATYCINVPALMAAPLLAKSCTYSYAFNFCLKYSPASLPYRSYVHHKLHSCNDSLQSRLSVDLFSAETDKVDVSNAISVQRRVRVCNTLQKAPAVAYKSNKKWSPKLAVR